jgi:serine/threonine protein kinase
MDIRAENFFLWKKGLKGLKIGKGSYGTVFRSGEGAVVKEIEATKKTPSGIKLAYREHVMSILQSFLVLEGHTPHLPLHYGVETSPIGPDLLSFHFYLEAFDCSLEAAPPRTLSTDKDWVCLLFQVSSALVCISHLLDVCHNDLYPRNVLIRFHPLNVYKKIRYDHYGIKHEVEWHALAALTDFGICSSPLLGSARGPEVKKKPITENEDIPFGNVPTGGSHVLNYTKLEPFSRDPYMLFKWGKFKVKGLPMAPASVRIWCTEVLSEIDCNTHRFHTGDGVIWIFKLAFDQLLLEKNKLPNLVPSPNIEIHSLAGVFTIKTQDRQHLLQRCTELLNSVSLKT